MTGAIFIPSSLEEVISILCLAAENRRRGRAISDAFARQLAEMVAMHGDALADAIEHTLND